MPKPKIVETDELPLCPHCERQLNTIHMLSKGIIEQTRVFLCPHCKKLLSIGYNFGW